MNDATARERALRSHRRPQLWTRRGPVSVTYTSRRNDRLIRVMAGAGRPSTSLPGAGWKDVDGRDKRGHDTWVSRSGGWY